MNDQVAGGGGTLPPGLDPGDAAAAEAALISGQTRPVADIVGALEARERVLSRVAAAKEANEWPWYEARLSVHVRRGKPTDTFGEGGDELAHFRASTQAPSFPDAVARLDADLAALWDRVTSNAALVDMEPSPEVMPAPVSAWSRPLVIPVGLAVLLVLAIFCIAMVSVSVAVAP